MEGCQQLQGWDYLARHARNVQLIRSRRTMEGYQQLQEWDYLARHARNVQLIRSRRMSKGTWGTRMAIIDLRK
jgi:hypothetical protein